MDYVSKSSSRSLYEQYVGNSSIGNKSHFASHEDFISDLSAYDMRACNITVGTVCKWDQKNCSGIPIAYSSEKETVFIDGSDTHTLLLGATGSKKSRLVVMPTIRILSAAGENMVICDPKGEIYRRTAGFLIQNDYDVHAVNFREPNRGDAWNMLEIPYKLFCSGETDKACEFINDMTINLIPITSKDPYWDYSARDVLFGLTLLLFTICKEKKLPDDIVNIKGLLFLREELFHSVYSSTIQETNLWKFAKNYDLIRIRLNGTVICPEKTLSCIISTFDQHMSSFMMQPQIVDMLSRSTFDVDDFGFKRKALFIIIPDEKTTFHRIVTILLKQVYEILIDNSFKLTPTNYFPVRINFVLDEFSSLPTISDFPQMIAASRSRNIRFILAAQSKHQMKQRYGEETHTIMSNCGNWLFLTSRETELLHEISELGGTTELDREPLISIFRLQHLDKEKGECLVFNGRKYPYIANLPDIDLYDGGHPITFDMPYREMPEKQILRSEKYFESIVSGYQEEKSTEYDLQKELERKFDELFGDLDDSESDSNQ